MTIPSGLITLNNNLLVVVDTETTGLIAGYHDVIQVAVVPLNADLNQLEGVPPFYMNIQPEYPERTTPAALKKNGLKLEELEHCPTKFEAADYFHEWFQALNLPHGKRLIYLCQNSPFDVAFLKHWLGAEGFDRYFCRRGRDTMFTAAYLNDRAAYQAQSVPFPSVSLEGLANKFGIPYEGAHDALNDCLITAKVYKEMLRML